MMTQLGSVRTGACSRQLLNGRLPLGRPAPMKTVESMTVRTRSLKLYLIRISLGRGQWPKASLDLYVAAIVFRISISRSRSRA